MGNTSTISLKPLNPNLKSPPVSLKYRNPNLTLPPVLLNPFPKPTNNLLFCPTPKEPSGLKKNATTWFGDTASLSASLLLASPFRNAMWQAAQNPTATFGTNVSKVLKSPFKGGVSRATHPFVPVQSLVLLTLPGLIQNDDPFKLLYLSGLACSETAVSINADVMNINASQAGHKLPLAMNKLPKLAVFSHLVRNFFPIVFLSLRESVNKQYSHYFSDKASTTLTTLTVSTAAGVCSTPPNSFFVQVATVPGFSSLSFSRQLKIAGSSLFQPASACRGLYTAGIVGCISSFQPFINNFFNPPAS